jgi:heme exporter protein B
MEMERHTAGMEALLLAPIPKAAVFLGKLLGAMVFLLAVEVLWVPAFALFCNLRLSLKEIMGLAAPLVLGTLSLAMMGTLLSTLCTFSRLGNVLFSLGYFPLALPVLLISLQATSQALRPETGSQGPWVHFLMAIDLIYLISCFLLFDYLVEE